MMSTMGLSRLEATLLVLAGGRSRRMGQAKALLPVGSTTLIEWVAQRLAPEFQHLLVAARSEVDLPPALRRYLVRDRYPGAGPLAGIEAGLGACHHDVLVAVACDMPAVTPALARALAAAAAGHDAAVPRVGGRPEPACAAYRRSAVTAVAAALREGRWKAADVLPSLDVRWLDDEDPSLFANINTPSDYQRFVDTLR